MSTAQYFAAAVQYGTSVLNVSTQLPGSGIKRETRSVLKTNAVEPREVAFKKVKIKMAFD